MDLFLAWVWLILRLVLIFFEHFQPSTVVFVYFFHVRLDYCCLLCRSIVAAAVFSLRPRRIFRVVVVFAWFRLILRIITPHF